MRTTVRTVAFLLGVTAGFCDQLTWYDLTFEKYPLAVVLRLDLRVLRVKQMRDCGGLDYNLVTLVRVSGRF